jgi:putative nucleotidyltransferase with HDIG domain
MQMMVQSYRALKKTIDIKSKWTADHSVRVASYSEKISLAIRLSDGEAKNLTVSAILHDIGKTALAEQLLNKDKRLSRDEVAMVRRHPEKGVKMVVGLPFYEKIKGGILYHHERWDGSGYPSGLKKHDIPLFARIIAVADVFDSLTSDRPYGKRCSREDALLFLQEKKGSHFAPEIVDIFTAILHSNNGNHFPIPSPAPPHAAENAPAVAIQIGREDLHD